MKILRNLKEQYKFPEELFSFAETPTMLVDGEGKKLGWKIQKDIYLDVNEDVEQVLNTLIPILKKQKAVSIPDTERPDRVGFVCLNGYSIFFACDYFTWSYIKLQLLKALNKTTMDAEDIHFGTQIYKFLHNKVDEEHLTNLYNYLWEEATK